ncbi:DoxX family membrane protein [bacterium]|nr:DoxX family membrane protein [bacterium]
MKKNIFIASRYLLGLIFFVFGAAGLFNLIPPPPDMPQDLQTFMNGIMATKYFFPLLKLTETLCGLLLLIGVAPALALVILAPISLNIFMLHLFVTPGLQNLVIPVAILALHISSAIHYWPLYQPLFTKAKK